jgi:hypothetical protein
VRLSRPRVLGQCVLHVGDAALAVLAGTNFVAGFQLLQRSSRTHTQTHRAPPD